MQVHEVVDLATSDAPPLRHTADDIVGAGRRAQRRRRAGWAAAGAAGLAVAAVAAVTAVPALTARPGNTPAAATSAAPARKAAKAPATFAVPDDPFTFTFGAFDAGRFHVQSPIVASTAYQIASVYADGMVTNDHAVDPADIPTRGKGEPAADRSARLYAYLVLYRPGAYNPAGLEGATKLTVAGHQARQLADDQPAPGHRVLAWEYAKDAWAVFESFGDSADNPSAAEMQAVVAGLKPAAPVPAKLPFRMGYVPAGYHAAELGSHAISGLNGIAGARDGDYGGAIFARPAAATRGLTEPYGGADGAELPGSFQVFVVPSRNSNQQLDGARPPAAPKCGHGFCNRWTADGTVQVQVASEGRLSDAEMSKIAKGVKLADVTDDATWFDAATALKATS